MQHECPLSFYLLCSIKDETPLQGTNLGLKYFMFSFEYFCSIIRNINASSILAWRIRWTEESGRLHSPWGRRVRHLERDLPISSPVSWAFTLG